VDEENSAEYLKQFKEVEKDIVRNNVLLDKARIDGRAMNEVRDINIELNF
jgi:polyribonucleotide nucleotidyltransferase